jgi:hypothetical protein
MKAAIYLLDGQPVTLYALSRAEGWPHRIVHAVMTGATPPTTRAALVDAIRLVRSQPIQRTIQESSRQANHQRKADYLTKRARQQRARGSITRAIVSSS